MTKSRIGILMILSFIHLSHCTTADSIFSSLYRGDGTAAALFPQPPTFMKLFLKRRFLWLGYFEWPQHFLWPFHFQFASVAAGICVYIIYLYDVITYIINNIYYIILLGEMQ